MWINLSNTDFRFFVFHDSFLCYPWCWNSPPCGKSAQDELHGTVCTCRMKWSVQGKLRATKSLMKLKKLSEVISVWWGATLLHSATAERLWFCLRNYREALMLFTDCSTHERPVMRLYQCSGFFTLAGRAFLSIFGSDISTHPPMH